MGETKKEIITRLKNIEVKLDMILSRTESRTLEEGNKYVAGVERAVQITGLAKSTLYNLICARQIPHFKKGKRVYFKCKELEDWIESGRRKTAEDIRTEAKNWDWKGRKPPN